jgi:hypothetical protein
MPASFEVWDVFKDREITDGGFAQLRGRNTRTDNLPRVSFCEGKDLTLLRAPQKSFDQTFWAVCREPTTKRRSLVATSETLLNGVSLLIFTSARPADD